MPNIYADIGAFRRRYVNSSAIDVDDATEVLRVLTAASRAVDEFCDRRFYAEIATRVFDGNDLDLLFLPDILAATSVKLDENTDGTFEVTLTATDYWLLRYGAQDQDGSPKTAIRLNKWKGARAKFVDLPRLLQIVGTWGYTQATEDSGATANEAVDLTETDIDVSDGTKLEPGQTILIDSEQMYVRDIRTGKTPNTITVTRAVNGTTAATHTSGTVINRYTYVEEVVEATLIQAGRLWKRRESAYSTIIQNPGLGTIEVFKGLDPDAQRLLTPYRRLRV